MDNYDKRESRRQMADTLKDGKQFLKAGKDYKFNNVDTNFILLKGHVGKDPYLNQEAKKCSFSLATSKNYKDDKGQWQSITQWHTIVCFDKLYDSKGVAIRQGQRLAIEGSLKYRDWTDGSGTKHTVAEIHATAIDQIVTVK